ncbi:major facilitator superfamily domain-containing protein [Durotheca rogersii]|uniref:major facilitator superfamily domain-containing protein n=1 Tax=Durotheca rogersii TaxID=419775 RepID=UPI00221FDBCC|nr:major facilitator superfamily domain-containing protein [Durotheca rogersii]KAI5861985.1 major facilitator superfamily domain-containing protein [Durotheca rogersii]
MENSPRLEEAIRQTHTEDTEADVKKPQAGVGGGDLAANLIGDQTVELTEEDNKRIRRKTDRHILTVLVWVYFLQILDKSALGYGAILGMREECNLTGNEYSMVGSISAIAQLVWLPFSSWLIVRVPHRILMPALVFGWGTAQACMGACNDYGGLLATRFLLGLFEAACLPLFSVITSQWYRRAEQPIRVAAWYGTNGVATMFAAAVSYGLRGIDSPVSSWRVLFILVGLLTVVTSVVVFFVLDSDVPSARFLTDHEKLQAIERLRANQTGTGSREFKWPQALEAVVEVKSWLFIGMALCLNVTAAVTNIFGPIILGGFGFSPAIVSLMNIPFGAVQLLVIFPSSYLAHRFRVKSPFLQAVFVPVLAGTIMLYLLEPGRTAPLLAAYYMLAFIFGANPILVSWMISNIGGTTKKSVIMALYNIGVSAGNIVGPLLFNQDDAPRYRPGLQKIMTTTCVLFAIVGLQVVALFVLNRMQERRRVRNGKPAKLHDASMEHRYTAAAGRDDDTDFRLGGDAFKDLTDSQNDEFVYVY